MNLTEKLGATVDVAIVSDEGDMVVNWMVRGRIRLTAVTETEPEVVMSARILLQELIIDH